ncbi:C40 family peptidase [Jidongwangia harbinensis]|uniref:C40 family peptidase n=1 Tax=Jidongwangia harbinensis TaxID=2878561 RepID=UPI001CD92687|nr:NlpC/P60 family protein [Jidongwangia harbinensis]MCA2214626.1 C40 family peptidase [Jidongwangia harbinensis]
MVPDAGSRPQPLGPLTMPGQRPTPTTTPTTPVVTPTGLPSSPLLTQIERRRTEIATLGDQLIKLGEDRDLALQQVTIAERKVTDAQAALLQAEREAAIAAANAFRDQAALPPGSVGSGLADLDALARMQRGESATEQAAARQLAIARAAQAAALTEKSAATARATDLSQQYTKLNASIAKKQTALQKLEQKHRTELSAAEAAESAADRRLGANYLDGAAQGRGADPRAVKAVEFALAQIGDPYVWSEEGPDQYDCSGLMYAAYRSNAAGNFPLRRVSRDQYDQTNDKTVDRYSLVPGDLLFFSSSNSWTGIHHVAMYAGEGKMVEAPRSGLNVRLVPVRWSRLFAATRIYGSVDGPTSVPNLNNPGNSGNPTQPNPTTTPPKTNPTTTPPKTNPTTTPPKTDPTTTPPKTDPTTTPPKTDPTTTPPKTDPTTTPPTTEPPAEETDPPEQPSNPPASSDEDESPEGDGAASSSAGSSSSASSSASASSSSSADDDGE